MNDHEERPEEHQRPHDQMYRDVEGASRWAERAELANDVGAGYGLWQELSQFGVRPTIGELWNLAPELAEEGRGLLSRPGVTALSRLGTGLSAVSALEHGGDVVTDFREHGMQAFNNRHTYDHLAETGLDVANTVLPWVPGAQAVGVGLNVGTAATNAAGDAAGAAFGRNARFSAGTAIGGVLDRMFGNDTLGDEAVRARGLRPDSAEARAIRAIENASPLALGYAVGRGVYDEGEAIVSAIANGDGAVGGALNGAGRAVGNAAVNTGRWVGNAAVTGGRAVGDAAVATGRAVGNAAVATGRFVGSAAIGTANAIGTGAAAVGSGAMAAGRGVGNAARSLWNW